MSLSYNVWVLSFIVLLASTYSYPNYQTKAYSGAKGEPFVPHEYTRQSEVEDACQSILSSASKVEASVPALNRLKQELSFIKGDWQQESGNAPLLPFDGRDAPQNSSDLPDPLKLVSFFLTHIDAPHKSRNSVKVNGVLGISISRNGTAPKFDPYSSPGFRLWPGSTELSIIFEGLYTESKANGGERVLCLLGTSNIPSRQADSVDPWKWVKDSPMYGYNPSLLEDDKILLVLHYPMRFTLTTRAVHGEVRSLNAKSSIKYFDKIFLSLQFGASSNYKYGSEEVVSAACTPYPYPDEFVGGHFDIYRGNGVCDILDRFANGEILKVIPNWNCNSTDDYCKKLGPFTSDKHISATDGGFTNVGLMMQDIRCEPRYARNNVSTTRVSAVFRVVGPTDQPYLAAQRTGLSNMTLSSEGIWDSASGQLCMVGCIGLAKEGCHSRICLYILTSFSINQRSVVLGRISSISDGHTTPHFPLAFERPVHPYELGYKFKDALLSYKYSKIKLAGALLEKKEPFDFGTRIKKSLLSYPKKSEVGDVLRSLSDLADDLTFHSLAVPDPVPKTLGQRLSVQLEVLSLDGLLSRYWSLPVENSTYTVAAPESKTIAEREMLLNVSAELFLSGEPYKNVSTLYLEGLYNAVDGKMYLIGCRDVRAPWRVLFESMDLEGGLDCLVEVKVEYPPTTARWLMNPTAKISINSRRNDDDPLHFSQVNLQTLPILYGELRQDILSRRSVEGILCILTLSLAIAFISSQLSFIRGNAEAAPYMSFVMLGVQALGYSIPLITGAEALFARMASQSYETTSFELEKNEWYTIVDYLVKVLVLGAFLLTLRLGQKVWKSRIRLLSRTPLEQWRVPSDRRVFGICLFIHVTGFSVVLIIHYVGAVHRPIQSDKYMDPSGHSYNLHEWSLKLEEYMGLVQDFFLLPQIIGNFLWAIKCKPLRKTYYLGITVIRILPHLYDYVRAPVFNPYFSEEFEFVNPSLDFYSQFGDIAILVLATIFATVIFMQQKWGCQKLKITSRSGERTLLPLGSRVYQKLPSMSHEAELVSGVNETEAQDKVRKSEE